MQNAPVRLPLTLSPLAVLFSLSLAALGCNEAKLIPAAGDAVRNLDHRRRLKAATRWHSGMQRGPRFRRVAWLQRRLRRELPCKLHVFVNNPTPDSDNNCIQRGSCICNEDAGTFAWTCYQ